MAKVELFSAVEETDEALKITLPVKRIYVAIGYRVFLLVVLALFSAQLISRLWSSADLFWPVVWLSWAFLAVILAVDVSELLWLFLGREVVKISNVGIQLGHTFAGRTFNKYFAAEAIDGVFVSREPFPRFVLYRDWEWRNFHRGWVALNSGRNVFGVRTFRFGESLTVDDAHTLVALMHERFPQYRYRAR